MARVIAPFRAYGGKGHLYKKLLPLIQPHEVYVETHCASAKLFFAKEPSPVEVLNDINGHIVNFMRCLQHPRSYRKLRRRLAYTLYSLNEFARAFDILAHGEWYSRLSRAWAWYVTQNQGFGGHEATCVGNWGRVFTSSRGMASTTSRWLSYLASLPACHHRLLMAQIDHRDAIDCIRYWDSPKTFFYCDPPYLAETRVKGHRRVYAYEMTAAQHRCLIRTLLSIEGKAMISGYDHPLYHALDRAGWKRYTFTTSCHAAGRVRGSSVRGQGAAKRQAPRTEVVWVKSWCG